jgi:hypothetical protein
MKYRHKSKDGKVKRNSHLTHRNITARASTLIHNYKNLFLALRNFEGKYPNCLIKTPDRLGQPLTSEGLEWRLPDLGRALHVREKAGSNLLIP